MTYEQFHTNEPEEKNLRWMAAIAGLFSLFGLGGMLVGQLYLKRCDRKSWLIFGGVIGGVAVLGIIVGSGEFIIGLAFVVGFIGMIVGTIKKIFGRDEWLVYGGAWAGALIPIGAILLIGGVEVTPRDESQRTATQRTVQNNPPPRSASTEKIAPQSESVSYVNDLKEAMDRYQYIQDRDIDSYQGYRDLCTATINVSLMMMKVSSSDHPADQLLVSSAEFSDVSLELYDHLMVCIDYGLITDDDIPAFRQYLR